MLIKKLTQLFQTLEFKIACNKARRGDNKSFYILVNKITKTYGAWIEEHSEDDAIRDEIDLPYPKIIILKSVMVSASFPSDTNTRNAMEMSAMLLANYRRGIGKAPLYMMGTPFKETRKLNKEQWLKFGASNELSAAFDRWSRFHPIIDVEIAQIHLLIKFAMRHKPQQIVSLLTALPQELAVRSMTEMFFSKEDVENRLKRLKEESNALLYQSN